MRLGPARCLLIFSTTSACESRTIFFVKKFLLIPLAAVAIWTAVLVTPLFRPDPPALNLYERSQVQTVLIRVADGAQGSGVVIERVNARGEPRFFVWTAAHVVEDVNQVEVVRLGRENGAKLDCEMVWQALVIARADAEDLALLWLDVPYSVFFSPVEFEFVLPKIGDPVYHCGNFYGANFDGSVSEGIISQIGVRPFDLRFRGWHWEVTDQTTAFAVPGSSGGGVFNQQGRVVGLIVGGPTEGFSCYVPVRIMQQVAEREGIEWALESGGCPSDVRLHALSKHTPTLTEQPQHCTH